MEISGLGFHREIPPPGQRPDPQEISSRVIGKLDKDGDGLLQVSELEGHAADRLQGADTDEDGLLSQEELVQRIEEKMAEHGGFEAGKMPDIQRLKTMMGQQLFAGGTPPEGEGADIFSMLDNLDVSDEDKEELKEAITNAPFDVFA